ncbi:MAG: hypothetical protein DRR00_11805 [Candidatus Parabeggiatoa sp. nov. 3]|nr:MAG: hypothetical protein DRR00_11805 [Gammaproteobacteria bacterium]
MPFAVKYPFICGSVLNRNNQGATTRDCPYGRFVGASQGECPLPLNTGLFVVQYLIETTKGQPQGIAPTGAL